jgi:YHS domain-containing protein
MIVRLLIAVGMVYLAYRLAKKSFLPEGREKEEFLRESSPRASEDTVQDPVCGTYVSLEDAYKTTINGKVLYFCSKECCEMYRAE